MSGTNFTIADQHDLLLAAAVAASAASGTYTLTLANDVLLAWVIPLTAPAGVTLRIDGNGFSLLGSFALRITGTGGTVVLNAANTSSYNADSDYVGYTIGTTSFSGYGTLEIARPDAAGLGVVSMISTSSDPGPSTVLKLDSGAVIGNPIQNGPAAGLSYPAYTSAPNVSIDLVGIVAAAPYATVDAGFGLVIPVLGGGSVLLQTESRVGTTFVLTPDGSGGTMAHQTNLAVSAGVTVRGAAGSVLTVPFSEPTAGPLAQPRVDPLNAAVFNGGATSFSANPGDALPTVPSGQTLEVIALSAGAYTLPSNAPAALVSTVAGAMSVTGGGADGQMVLVGIGGLTFTAGAGRGSVIAGGGDNAVTIGAGMGSQFVSLGGGNDTVRALGGDDTIAAGAGSNLVKLGTGASSLLSSGADTILGGGGSATINVSPAGAGNALVLLGPAGSFLDGAGGSPTVVSGTGNDTISTSAASSALIFLNQGMATTYLGGADTLIGGSAAATVDASGGSLIFGGSGALTVNRGSAYGSATATVVGGLGAPLSINPGGAYNPGYSGLTVFAYGPTQYDGSADYGAATVVSAGPALTVTAPYGGGAFLGGSAGGNLLDAHATYNTAMLVAGGDQDTLVAGQGPTYVNAGAGAETLVGSVQQFFTSGLTLLTLANGNATDLLFQNFDPHIDYLSLTGFPAGEAAAALAGATTVGGSEVLTLSDGTHITFEAFIGLTAANFL